MPGENSAGLRLSVIVPVHNGGEDLRRCLQGLTRSSRPADESIVGDDGSSDGSAALAAAAGARVLTASEGPRGPAFARNRGVFVKFPELELDGLQPFCYVDFEARRSELHIHTFAAYPDQVTMIKTQSLFDFQ